MRQASLRTYLLALTACAVIPVLCFAAYVTLALSRTEQGAIERGLVETATALVSAVDRELTSTITTLEVLATSQYLDRPDLEGFWHEIARALESQKRHGWVTVHLAAPDGTPLVNALYAPGSSVPRPHLASVRETVASGKPTMSNLISIPSAPHAYGVQVPVVRAGALRYVLTAELSAYSQREVLLSQSGVRDRIAVLFDRHSTIVFRTVNPDELVGTPVTPRLAREAADRPSGVLDDVNREGTPVRTVFQRSTLSGWTVAVGVPRPVLYAAQRQSLREVFTVGAMILALSTVLALLVARSIRRSVNQLVTDAEGLSGPSDFPRTTRMPITELARLRNALAAAAHVIRERGASLERQLEELRVARHAAEVANRAKDEFLTLVSHELRTPLNAVYGWARMLRSGQLTGETADRALDSIIRNANAQVQLIDDLLDVSRVVAGKVRLDVQEVDLKSVIEHAIESVQPAAEAKRIRLQTVFDLRAGTVLGDPARLQQIVWNLLINAVKFTDGAGPVHVSLQAAGSHVELIVSDTGRGIAPDLLPVIFERFRQADSSSTRPHGGLGLGLALVKYLVELHGGTVAAHSAGEGKGATFTVTLPAATAEISEKPASVANPAPLQALEPVPFGVRLDGLRVVVIDDDRDAVELVGTVLAKMGA